MINLQTRKSIGTKQNIKAYREHCIKNDCFCTLTFEQYIINEGLNKYLR